MKWTDRSEEEWSMRQVKCSLGSGEQMHNETLMKFDGYGDDQSSFQIAEEFHMKNFSGVTNRRQFTSLSISLNGNEDPVESPCYQSMISIWFHPDDEWPSWFYLCRLKRSKSEIFSAHDWHVTEYHVRKFRALSFWWEGASREKGDDRMSNQQVHRVEHRASLALLIWISRRGTTAVIFIAYRSEFRFD